MIIVHALQVNNGDCFMLVFPNCSKPKLLVIDSGYVGNFQKFKNALLRLIEDYDCDVYMVLTHIDRDHIGGFKCLFRNFNPKICERVVGFYYNTLESIQRFAPCVTKEMVQADDEISVTTKTGYADAVTLENFLTEKKSSYRPDYKLVVISIFVMVFGHMCFPLPQDPWRNISIGASGNPHAKPPLSQPTITNRWLN